jgi:putative membrane protein
LLGADDRQPRRSRPDDPVEEAITVMYYGDHMSGWGWALAGVGMVVFWGLVITGIVLLVRYLGQAGQRTDQPPPIRTPEQVLGVRFAHGEIDETEYQNRLAVLREHVRS